MSPSLGRFSPSRIPVPSLSQVPVPSPGGRLTTRLGAGLMLLAALAVGRVVSGWVPDDKAGSAPFERYADVGQSLALRYGDVEVTEVEGAPQVVRTGSGYASPALWLVVTFDYTPRDDSRVPQFAQVRGGDGTTLTDTLGNTRNAMSCERANPGITVECAAMFEVSDEALPGASLVLAQDNQQDQRHDDMAVIDLGIERSDVIGWRTVTEPLTFPLDREDAS